MTITSYSGLTSLSQSCAINPLSPSPGAPIALPTAMGHGEGGDEGLFLQHMEVGHRDAAQHRAHDPQEPLVVAADEQVLQVHASRLDFAWHAVHRSVQVAGPLLDGPRREEVREHDAVPEIGDEL